MNNSDIIQILKKEGLRVTPQRIAILEAVIKLGNHPSTEQIIETIKANHPSISVGTIYNILDSLVQHAIIDRVKTENGVMRYDSKVTHHHHLYCSRTDKIEDYIDTELDDLIANYFKTKGISDFKIDAINLQITGEFKH